jgi:hypothetical protein
VDARPFAEPAGREHLRKRRSPVERFRVNGFVVDDAVPFADVMVQAGQFLAKFGCLDPARQPGGPEAPTRTTQSRGSIY